MAWPRRYSSANVRRIRTAELEAIADWFPPGARILDVGSGTGTQARCFTAWGHRVEAIDVELSANLEFPVRLYDGLHFPVSDGSIDIVFSSNVLEHVMDLAVVHSETARVLSPEGQAIHVLPTHVWRAWTTATGIPMLSLPRRHGVRGNVWSETALYHPTWWRAQFRAAGFKVMDERPTGLFYTGSMLMAERLGIEKRRVLASWLGSSGHAYKLGLGLTFRTGHDDRRLASGGGTRSD